MNYLELHEKIKRTQNLTNLEADTVIADLIHRSISTVQGYRCDSRYITKQALSLLNAIFN